MAGKKLNIYMEEYLIKDLKKIAIDKDTSVSKILTELAVKYVKKEKDKNN